MQSILTAPGTSKYQSEEPYLGQYGTFLASLSAMSLLTITSHHYAYRSHSSVSFHHSQAIERQLPSIANNHFHSNHGTRVTVRNLFGNMPVRVKQRSMVTGLKAEHRRLREVLKRDVVGLLLSWQGPISLKIRDADNKLILNLNTSNATESGNGGNTSAAKPRTAHLSMLLHTLTQANYIGVDEWSSWVPASASTATLSVRGAISLEPTPIKRVQFISFGLRPLSSDGGHNELYDQVNRLFALSSFGTIEDDADVDEQEMLRRQSDRRFKSDGYTNRQLKARKGVDRYPMFHLQILLKNRRASDLLEDSFIEDETNLQAVVDVLSAMITQWLLVHHFRPKKMHQRSNCLKTVSTPLGDDTQNSRLLKECTTLPGILTRSLLRTPHSKHAATNASKRRKLDTVSLENSYEKPRQQAFAEWSRIKSGKSSFFDGTTTLYKAKADDASRNPHPTSDDQDSQWERTMFGVAPVSDSISAEAVAVAATSFKLGGDNRPVAGETDETMLWTDPSTRKKHVLNARTGCVVPPRQSLSQTDPVSAALMATQADTSKARQISSKPARTPWLSDLLQTWDNPIFKPSGKGIQQMPPLSDLEQEQQHSHFGHTHCSHFETQYTLDNVGSESARLSKEGLRSAKVIAQVDKKFILVTMESLSGDSEVRSNTEVLVLIDQHAADERIGVESLLADLCNPTNNGTHSGYRSKLGFSSPVASVNFEKPLQFMISPQESDYFRLYAASFAAWGILYDISSSASLTGKPLVTERSAIKLSVTTLPRGIAERCRADPQVLMSFLRSAVWKYVDSPPPAPVAPHDYQTNWVKKIATCPPGLIDMINSRACRSAIMFNDNLSLQECKTLVGKLADCVFPFMCAHGRPSMVPIVDVSRIERSNYALDPCAAAEKNSAEGFVNAWKNWKR